MSMHDPSPNPSLAEPPLVTGLAVSAEAAAESAALARHSEPTTPVRKGYITALVVSYFALYVAWIAPTAFSLAIRIQQLDAAGKNGIIALAVGLPSLTVLITGPLVGVLSDRTTLRFGRRRSWMLGGMVAGLIGSLIVGVAPSVPIVVVAWTFAFVGYTTAGGMFVTHLGDRLPKEQQGRVSGITGAVTQVAPILGITIAGAFSSVPLAMFGAPAAVAFVLGLIFIFVMKDGRITAPVQRASFAGLLRGFGFNPRRHPDFAWVWISRFSIFLALSFMSVYTVYLLAQRLHLGSAALSGLVSSAGLLGVVVSIVGALGSGALSDRLRTRKPFILVGAVLLAGGLCVMGTTASVPQYFIGSAVAVFGVGIFGAIDQAIGLDTLPREQGENGRFIGIFNLANALAQGVGPFLAAGVLAVAASDYTWVYLVAAVLAIAGGLLILAVRPDRPRTVEPKSRRA